MKKKLQNTSKFHAKEIKKKKSINDDYKMAISFVIVLLIVLALLGLLFFLNGKYVTKDEFQGKTTTTTTAPSYDDTVVLVNDIFGLSDKKYYVLAYEFNDKAQAVLCSSLVNNYKNEDIDLYSVNLGIAFNSKYYNKEKEENIKTNKYSDFNFTKPTLLVIEKNKVLDAITDKNKITEMLKVKDEA